MYNGHKNWNHWNVALWINNVQSLYNESQALVAEMGKDRAAEYLVETLRRSGDTHTPDGAPYSKTAIRAALRDI